MLATPVSTYCVLKINPYLKNRVNSIPISTAWHRLYSTGALFCETQRSERENKGEGRRKNEFGEICL